MKKVCNKCSKAKDVSEFHFPNKANWRHACDECVFNKVGPHKVPLAPEKAQAKQKKNAWSIEQKTTYKILNEEISNLKLSLGCQNKGCMWNGPYTVNMLEFHHLRDKMFAIGHYSSLPFWSRELVFEEIAKCVLLCSNCHRKLHFGTAKP